MTEAPTPLRILVADDHTLVCRGIQALLQRAGHDASLSASTAKAALREALRHRPDVVLMDISFEDGSGLDALEVLVGRWPEACCIMLSMHAASQYIEAALAAGARGYVVKDAAAEELLDAVEAVSAGETYLSREARMTASAAFAARARGEAREDPLADLTPREVEILTLVAEGMTSAEIAEGLGISPRTVDTHRNNLSRKLEIHSIAGLTRFAIRAGLCEA